jgi:hypothetical protein
MAGATFQTRLQDLPALGSWGENLSQRVDDGGFAGWYFKRNQAEIFQKSCCRFSGHLRESAG